MLFRSHQKDAQEIVSRSQIKLEAKDLEQSDQEASVQEVKTRQEMPAIIQGMPEEVEVVKRVQARQRDQDVVVERIKLETSNKF